MHVYALQEKHLTSQKTIKRNPWWTKSTNVTKNRKSMRYSIWKSCHKPRVGHVSMDMCKILFQYKLAKTKYRQACREAFNTNHRNTFKTLNALYHTHDSKKFWKIVRKRRHNNNDPSSNIDLQTLVKHYTNKFRVPSVTSDVITASRKFVSDKQQQRSTYRIKLSTFVVVKYICALKLNCSPAGDSIESEHL